MNDIPPPPPPYSPPPAPPAMGAGYSADERMWAMLGHLSALSGLLTGGVGNIVGPLIVWQVKKESQPFAAAEAKEALNFNLSWFLWGLILVAVAFVLTFILVGLLLWPVVALLPVVMIVLSIIGGLRANEGRPYRYPATVRFIP